MACRIEVGMKKDLPDPAGESLLKRINSELGIGKVKAARVVDIYTIEEDLSQQEKEQIGQELLSDPVIQDFSVDAPLMGASEGGFSYAIHVGFKPGVKDNVGDTSKEAIGELLGKKLSGGVYTSKCFLLWGELDFQGAERIALELLANPLIHRFEIKTAQQFASLGFAAFAPKVEAVGGGLVSEIDLNVSDKKLLEISRRRLLSLSIEEMRRIRDYYADPDTIAARKQMGMPLAPTDVELEAIAQTWSEHCKHKIFNAKIAYKDGKKKKAINSLFKTYIKAATEKLARKKKWLVSVFKDNAGIFEFVPGWNVAMKVETHNTPSALDPYGGALTGILGVNRDVLGCGLGAKPIFNTDVFCFAPPDYQGKIPPRLFHPRRVMEGVRAGVAAGGNASGIPTINGALFFDESYLGKPLVYCGTGGLMPSEIAGRKTHEKGAMPKDRIFMAGGRIGKDGIHGATFSSVELHEGSPVSAVQLGDPYTQKKLADFLLEARDLGLFNAVTDNGAGGLSSSVGEMAQSCGGCILHLDRAPLKYPGLDPWEILLSESQERMTFAVPPSKAGEFVQLARLRNVEVSDLGEFNSSGFMHVKYGAKTVAYLDMDFLHNGLPQMELEAEASPRKLSEPPPILSSDPKEDLLSLLSRPNIRSKEWIIRQYDHEVQGTSAVKPLCGKNAEGPSDAAVIVPLPQRKEGLVVSNGLCPRLSMLDAYQMAANAVDEAVRNFVAAGGSLERACALDNFCWPDPVYSPDNPDGKHKLALLVQACQGLHDACMAYGIPLISGKDSMKNDYRHGKWKISVLPTLLVSMVGRIDDASKAATTDFKSPGDLIYLLGLTKDELGGSEYYAMKGILGANFPKVDFKRNAKLYRKLEAAIKRGMLASCHDCSEGGLAVALAESCMGGMLGAQISLDGALGKMVPSHFLFSESAGRFVVSVKKGKEKAFARLMRKVGCFRLGRVSEIKQLHITYKGKPIVSAGVGEMLEAWKKW
ncbi:MAG: phosphoribosylformylglycinamidine synthase subunit PurL [Candidatus Micrarchaeota archaeon]|nr:phosphoribosylformylglycinamidine synthase subunit PurL [Candidatus Micrarchaeota archaeon]